MDIYDDLERFKHQIQQNTPFLQFESSRSQEMAMGKYTIFHQLDAQFSNQALSCAATELDSSDSHDSSTVTEKTSQSSIFDSVSKISSKQSLDRLLHSTGVTAEHETSLALVGNH